MYVKGGANQTSGFVSHPFLCRFVKEAMMQSMQGTVTRGVGLGSSGALIEAS